MYSWRCEPFSEFTANSLEKKVTLLKGGEKREKRKRIINTAVSEQHGILLNNLKIQSTGDLLSQRMAKKASVHHCKYFPMNQKYHLSLSKLCARNLGYTDILIHVLNCLIHSDNQSIVTKKTH